MKPTLTSIYTNPHTLHTSNRLFQYIWRRHCQRKMARLLGFKGYGCYLSGSLGVPETMFFQPKIQGPGGSRNCMFFQPKIHGIFLNKNGPKMYFC